MRTENWEKVKELLDEVLQIEPSNRQTFLKKVGVSNEIRAEVESLIAFESEAENLMNMSAIEFSKDFFADEENSNSLIGQQIGNYRIIRELGYGGMGAVYLAERTDGKFEQKVALKLLKREMNTSAIRRHFQQEGKILASLEHTNIARLLDAGTTDDNAPYLAMEYIEGLPIDNYCLKHNLNLNERLDLFRQVCTAVNFAHRNLIVHRDLKPSNILITEEGVPKLLDFGISKILSSEFEQVNAATVTRLGAMTPSYASPEQLQRESVTTSTDIYSLGIILYELLSGHRPFEEKEDNLKDIYQAVLETDPPLPSSKLEKKSREFKTFSEKELILPQSTGELPTIAFEPKQKTEALSRRYTKPETFYLTSNSLRGDLDNIILKALRKEPERRYSSAENFAEDILRHQKGLPVTARPNTFAYRAEKFFKRNRVGVIAGILIVLAIIAGVIATLWQARVAQAERLKAEKRFGDVRKLANSYLFEVYPEIENLEGSLKARERIITNALQYLNSLSNEASGDLELQGELATAYEKIGDVLGALNNSSLGNIQAGLDSYGKARNLRETIYLVNPANLEAKEKLANNYYVVARTLWNNSQTKEAEEMFERGLKLRRELVQSQPDSVEFKNRLAVMLIDYGAIPVFNSQTEKALILFNEALGIIEKLREKEPANSEFKKTLARLLRIMSKAKGSVGDYEGGIRSFAQALQLSKELANEFPKDFRIQRTVWLTSSMTCELYIDKNDGAKAVETCPPTIEFPKKALENEPENGVVAYDLAISYFNTARAYRLAENFDQTIAQTQKALEVMKKLSDKSPENMEYKRNLAIYETEKARAQLNLNQNEQVISAMQKVIEMMIPIIESNNEATYQNDLALAYRLSAMAFSRLKNKAKAVEFIDKAIAIIRKLSDEKALRDSDKNLLTELETEKSEYGK